jgi:hypothetical protein
MKVVERNPDRSPKSTLATEAEMWQAGYSLKEYYEGVYSDERPGYRPLLTGSGAVGVIYQKIWMRRRGPNHQALEFEKYVVGDRLSG